MFIVHASETRYCIFQTTIVQQSEPPIWRFDILENPKYILRNATYMNDYVIGRQQTITHQRIMRTGEIKQYQVVMRRLTSYFSINGIGIIPFYKMTRRLPGLSSKFQKVVLDRDDGQKYHFNMTQPGVIPDLQILLPIHSPAHTPYQPPTPPVSAIPIHVLQGFIQSELAKGSQCAITLEPLSSFVHTCGVAALPCGHLFANSALQDQIDRESSVPLCAVCRTPFTPSSVVVQRLPSAEC
jgi:hypothetical protein